MENGNILTSGVYQNNTAISGDWNNLKNDTKALIQSIENSIKDIIDNNNNNNNNDKIKGYKNSLSNLLSSVNIFYNKLSNKSGIVKANDDDYTVYLEDKFYLEKIKSELSLLCNTVNVLTMTKEI